MKNLTYYQQKKIMYNLRDINTSKAADIDMIFLLLILSKVTEKVVHEQTTKFLNDNNIFDKYQSGLRSNHSTSLFLSFLNDKVLKVFDNAMYTGMILIDL